jgi:hypothetical protein
VTKPADVGNFHETIRKIDDFFVTVVRRPPPNPGGQIKTLMHAELPHRPGGPGWGRYRAAL